MLFSEKIASFITSASDSSIDSDPHRHIPQEKIDQFCSAEDIKLTHCMRSVKDNVLMHLAARQKDPCREFEEDLTFVMLSLSRSRFSLKLSRPSLMQSGKNREKYENSPKPMFLFGEGSMFMLSCTGPFKSHVTSVTSAGALRMYFFNELPSEQKGKSKYDTENKISLRLDVNEYGRLIAPIAYITNGEGVIDFVLSIKPKVDEVCYLAFKQAEAQGNVEMSFYLKDPVASKGEIHAKGDSRANPDDVHTAEVKEDIDLSKPLYKFDLRLGEFFMIRHYAERSLPYIYGWDKDFSSNDKNNNNNYK